MTSPDINSALLRVAAIQIEAMASIGESADAKPYFYHFQESFPYFTNRIGEITLTDDGSEDYDRDTYPIIMRLVVAHITEGYVGEIDDRLYDYIPLIKTYFNERQWLQSATYLTALDGLIRARVTACSGWRAFQNAGVSGLQVGTEFTLSCEFDETIEQVYN